MTKNPDLLINFFTSVNSYQEFDSRLVFGRNKLKANVCVQIMCKNCLIQSSFLMQIRRSKKLHTCSFQGCLMKQKVHIYPLCINDFGNFLICRGYQWKWYYTNWYFSVFLVEQQNHHRLKHHKIQKIHQIISKTLEPSGSKTCNNQNTLVTS